MPGGLAESDIKEKVKTILACSDMVDKIMTLTGFEDASELSLSMFQILALLEMQSHAYLESDVKTLGVLTGEEKQQIGGQRDRLLTYLTLLSHVKKQRPSGNGSLMTSSQPDFRSTLSSFSSVKSKLESSPIVDELNEKLKIQQEALHERYKELAEKDDLIAILREENERLKVKDSESLIALQNAQNEINSLRYAQPIPVVQIKEVAVADKAEVEKLKLQIGELIKTGKEREKAFLSDIKELKQKLETANQLQDQSKKQLFLQDTTSVSNNQSLLQRHAQEVSHLISERNQIDEQKRMFEIKLYELQNEANTLKEALMLERTNRQIIEQSSVRLQREVDSFCFKEGEFREKPYTHYQLNMLCNEQQERKKMGIQRRLLDWRRDLLSCLNKMKSLKLRPNKEATKMKDYSSQKIKSQLCRNLQTQRAKRLLTRQQVEETQREAFWILKWKTRL